jgi:UDP-2,4-diacetamido-2,4,6-trideoxy-beta-L-altropyranose hydrolase
MTIQAIFVTAASPETGGGHVLRCMALAEKLATLGCRPVFAVNRTTIDTVHLLRRSPFEIVEVEAGQAHFLAEGHKTDIVVFDGYRLDEKIEHKWREYATVRVAIDDLASRRHETEILLDNSPGRQRADYSGLLPDGCIVLAGTSFALLRPAFARARQRALSRRSASAPKRLLVAMGLTDVGSITRRVVEGVLMTNLGLSIDVVVGHGAGSLGWLRRVPISQKVTTHVDLDADAMADLMLAADVAIGGGGGTGLERCCLGLPSLSIVLADNQRTAAEVFSRAGAARLIGDLATVTAEQIAASVAQFSSDGTGRLDCSRAASALVDGKGADRVCRAILEKLGNAV